MEDKLTWAMRELTPGYGIRVRVKPENTINGIVKDVENIDNHPCGKCMYTVYDASQCTGCKALEEWEGHHG